MNLWQKILETAIYTPSPHNVQPWRIKILDENRAELFIDSTRTLPKEDTTGSFIILALGMFLESITILCRQNGYSLHYELLREPQWFASAILAAAAPTLLPFARLTIKPAAQSTDESYAPELFLKRRTSRLTLTPEFIPPAAFQSLTNLAAEWQQNYYQTVDVKQIERILGLNTDAMFEDMNAPDYHAEITEWFRFSERESKEKRDGLDYRCMNTPRPLFWLAARQPWLMKTPVLSNVLTSVYRSQLGTVPTIGFLAGDFWQPAAAVKTGRFLMRFWLETARHNLYLHPYGNLVTNRRAAMLLEKELGIKNIWLIFKIGLSAEPPLSRRLPLEKILIN